MKVFNFYFKFILVLVFSLAIISKIWVQVKSPEQKKPNYTISLALGNVSPNLVKFDSAWNDSAVRETADKLGNALLTIQENPKVIQAVEKLGKVHSELMNLEFKNEKIQNLEKQLNKLYSDSQNLKEVKEANDAVTKASENARKLAGLDALSKERQALQERQKEITKSLNELNKKYSESTKQMSSNPALKAAIKNLSNVLDEKIGNERDQIEEQIREETSKLKKQLNLEAAQQELKNLVGPEVMKAQYEFDEAVKAAREREKAKR